MLRYMSAPVAHLVTVEVLEMAGRAIGGCMLTSLWKAAVVAVMLVKVVINIAMEVTRPMEPWPCADEQAVIEPLRPVITVGSAIVGRPIVVAVGARWRSPVSHPHADIGMVRSAAQKQQGRHQKKKTPDSQHKQNLTPTDWDEWRLGWVARRGSPVPAHR